MNSAREAERQKNLAILVGELSPGSSAGVESEAVESREKIGGARGALGALELQMIPRDAV